MTDQSPRPINDWWRVDVAGYPISVKGEHAHDHLQSVNGQLSRMKMALHRISKNHPNDATGDMAREGLKNV